MFKKTVVLGVALLMGAAHPALGASGKVVKPYKSETVTIQFGRWTPYGSDPDPMWMITAQEFQANCAIPTETQGFDAYVFEVPRPYRTIEAAISTKGEGVDITGTAEYHDVDIYIYDADCTQIAEYATNNTDEKGFLPKNSAFILLSNYSMTNPFNPKLNLPVSGSAQVSFSLKPSVH